MNIKILVATHKTYWMPEDEIYLPIQVGCAINSNDLGYARDDSGDNISSKNKNYCELTGLYWAWKNLDADYIGLAHYRRHFTLRKGTNKQSLPIKSDVILHRKRYYYIENTYYQYINAHHQGILLFRFSLDQILFLRLDFR